MRGLRKLLDLNIWGKSGKSRTSVFKKKCKKAKENDQKCGEKLKMGGTRHKNIRTVGSRKREMNCAFLFNQARAGENDRRMIVCGKEGENRKRTERERERSFCDKRKISLIIQKL